MTQLAYTHDYLGHHIYAKKGYVHTSPNHDFVLSLCKSMTIHELETLVFQLDVLLGKMKGEKEDGRTT